MVRWRHARRERLILPLNLSVQFAAWEARCRVTTWNPVLRIAADGITFGG
jgi:hypothetical protein